MYLEENTHQGMVKFVVSAELLLSIVEKDHFTIFKKEYLQLMYVRVSRSTLCSNIIHYILKTKKQLIHDLHNYGGQIYGNYY